MLKFILRMCFRMGNEGIFLVQNLNFFDVMRELSGIV